jgi:indolepyruvate ferredoxin oxidoreductase
LTAAGDRLTGNATAVEIAELPDIVRGYEEIKMRNVTAYRERLALLRVELSAQAPHATVS